MRDLHVDTRYVAWRLIACDTAGVAVFEDHIETLAQQILFGYLAANLSQGFHWETLITLYVDYCTLWHTMCMAWSDSFRSFWFLIRWLLGQTSTFLMLFKWMEITEILMLLNVKEMLDGHFYRGALIAKKYVKYCWKSCICLLIKKSSFRFCGNWLFKDTGFFIPLKNYNKSLKQKSCCSSIILKEKLD